MASVIPKMASRIDHVSRGLNTGTGYGKRMTRLSNRIFTEVTRPTDIKSIKVVQVMADEPVEQREDKGVGYYPNLPMFHYLTKMLSLHGLYMDDHMMFRKLQVECL